MRLKDNRMRIGPKPTTITMSYLLYQRGRVGFIALPLSHVALSHVVVTTFWQCGIVLRSY